MTQRGYGTDWKDPEAIEMARKLGKVMAYDDVRKALFKEYILRCKQLNCVAFYQWRLLYPKENIDRQMIAHNLDSMLRRLHEA